MKLFSSRPVVMVKSADHTYYKPHEFNIGSTRAVPGNCGHHWRAALTCTCDSLCGSQGSSLTRYGVYMLRHSRSGLRQILHAFLLSAHLTER